MIDIERSERVPASLAKEQSWDEEDVRRALHQDFFGKCYLCERCVMLGETEVDHRRPRATGDDGKFHWPNLFPACQYCNKRRSRKYPVAGLISPGEGVERRVVQMGLLDAEGLELTCEFLPFDVNDAAAVETARELRHLHSASTATTARARFAARELLEAVHDRYLAEVYPLEIRVLRIRRRGESDGDAEAELRRLLSRRAPFTMLTRSFMDPSLADLFD